MSFRDLMALPIEDQKHFVPAERLPSDIALARVHLELSAFAATVERRARRNSGRLIVTELGWSYESGKAGS